MQVQAEIEPLKEGAKKHFGKALNFYRTGDRENAVSHFNAVREITDKTRDPEMQELRMKAFEALGDILSKKDPKASGEMLEEAKKLAVALGKKQAKNA